MYTFLLVGELFTIESSFFFESAIQSSLLLANNLHLPSLSSHSLLTPLALPIFQVEKKTFYLAYIFRDIDLFDKNYMFLSAWKQWRKRRKKNAVRIFWVFFSSFSSSTISRLYSQFILPFDMSPYKATCLWKYVKQPKVREKLMIRDNIQQTCMRFNRFYFGSFVFFSSSIVALFSLVLKLLTSWKWVSHDITRTNQMKRKKM